MDSVGWTFTIIISMETCELKPNDNIRRNICGYQHPPNFIIMGIKI